MTNLFNQNCVLTSFGMENVSLQTGVFEKWGKRLEIFCIKSAVSMVNSTLKEFLLGRGKLRSRSVVSGACPARRPP